MCKNHVDRRNLHAQIAKTQQQAVFFWDAIETPCMIWSISGQIENSFHPMAAPRTRIEERNHSKRLLRRGAQAPSHRISSNHLRGSGRVGIQKEIEVRQQSLLQSVCSAPIQKEAALVHLCCSVIEIICSKIAGFAAALTLLDLPPSQVRVDKQVIARKDLYRTRAKDQNGAAALSLNLTLNGVQFLCIEEIDNLHPIH